MIIDCLEFNRDFRILDPVEELAFLALECEWQDAPKVGELILKIYSDETGDLPPESLVFFYKSYRACLRAKIALWHIGEPHSHTAAHWQDVARKYLDIAEQYVTHFR